MRKQKLLLVFVLAVCLVTALPAILAASAGALSFAPPVHYGLGGRPADLASADLNGDDRPDLVASSGVGVDVLLGVERGRFAPATRIPLEHRPGAIALADIDGSGTQDVVTANRDGTVTVLLGAGDGSFVIKGTYPSGASASFDVVAGDLSGDSVPDVATAGGDDGVSILRGDGAGGLVDPLRLPVGARCWRLVAADLDLDGSLDLAASRYEWDEYSGFAVLLADGAGGFSPPAFVNTGDDDSSPHGLAACSAELRRDTRPGRPLWLRGRKRLLVPGRRPRPLRHGRPHVLQSGRRCLGARRRRHEPRRRRRRGHHRSAPGRLLRYAEGAAGTSRGSTSCSAGASAACSSSRRPSSPDASPGEVIAVDLNGDKRPDLATTDSEPQESDRATAGACPC